MQVNEQLSIIEYKNEVKSSKSERDCVRSKHVDR
jgi:hypothetical protein